MPGLIKRPRTGFNRAPFRLSDMKRLEDLVDSRPTPTERGKWSKEDIRRIARLFTPAAAAGRLQEIAKRPDIDKTRLAK